MKKLFGVLSAILVTLVFNGCAGTEVKEVEKQDEVKKMEVDRMVARVASVNKEAKYVLIQRFGKLIVPDNSILYSLGRHAMEDNKAASIKMTGERLGQFLAADIISGELAVGDAVYLRILEEKPTANIQ